MKKVIYAFFSVVVIVSVCLFGFWMLNPVMAEETLNKLTGVTQPVTQAPTTPQVTEPPTEAVPQIKAIAEKDELEVGETVQVEVTVDKPLETGQTVQYKSSNSSIAEVSPSGLVTAKSQGECSITVFVTGYEGVKNEAIFTVKDKRLKELNILNDYLAKIPLEQEYTYGSKKAKATLENCIIKDFNDDEHYELFILYRINGKRSAAEIVTVENDKAVSYRTDKSFADISKLEVMTYHEEIYLDGSNTPLVIAQAEKTTEKYNELTTTRYVMNSKTLAAVETLTAQDPVDIERDKGKYKKDGEEVKREVYVDSYTKTFNLYSLVSKYNSKYVSIGENKYIKAEMPVDLGEAYFSRVEWISSNSKVAKVSENGVITGVKLGNCVVTGTLEGFKQPVVTITVHVAEASDGFDAYIKEEKKKSVTGENGETMSLYAYRVKDMTGDGQKELFLYYVGSSACQIDMVTTTGSHIDRSTVIYRTSKSGAVCMLEFYQDKMTQSLVLCEQHITEASSNKTVEFYYNSYSGTEFKKSGNEYKIENNSSYYINGDKVDKAHFENSLSRYEQDGDWEKV